jgi:hypothetical protein
MRAVEHALALDRARLAALQAQAQAPTVEAFKAATRSAIQALELFTHSEKVGLIGEIEDAWARLEGG